MKAIVESLNAVTILIGQTKPSSDEVGTILHGEGFVGRCPALSGCVGCPSNSIQSNEERHQFRHSYNIPLQGINASERIPRVPV